MDITGSNSSHKQRDAVEPPVVASAAMSNRDQSVEPSDSEVKQNPLKKLKASNGKKALDNWIGVMNKMLLAVGLNSSDAKLMAI